MNQKLIDFYTKEGKDDEGRTLQDILSLVDEDFNNTHDLIQWLFPTYEKSEYNPFAPLLDNETVEYLLNSEEFLSNYMDSFHYFLYFLGFRMWGTGKRNSEVFISYRPSWDTQKRNWFYPHNHTVLRISRVLTSLIAFKQYDYADALYTHLESLFHTEEGSRIIQDSIAYWSDIISTIPEYQRWMEIVDEARDSAMQTLSILTKSTEK